MKILNNFNDFLFENAVSNDLPFRLSDRLIRLLEKIDHPISNRLISLSDDRTEKDITFINIKSYRTGLRISYLDEESSKINFDWK